MNLGTVLVLFGILLAVLDLLLGYSGRSGRWIGALTTVAVILVGIGVLVGVNGLQK